MAHSYQLPNPTASETHHAAAPYVPLLLHPHRYAGLATKAKRLIKAINLELINQITNY